METFLIKALQLILSLSILVLVHEFGHFLFARLFKTRVEKFYLFFNPWLTLYKFKPKNSETEYGLGWLPLGGYCKIAGMIDESMDKEQMKQPPQPYEFRSKTAVQRLLIMIGGVLFNFILALFIYSMILFAWGESYIPLKNMAMGMEYSNTFKNAGFEDGDILLRTNNVELERYGQDAFRAVINAQSVTVLRNGLEHRISIPADIMQQYIRDGQGFANTRYPLVVKSLSNEVRAATLAGLQPGDSIVSINGEATPTFYDVSQRFNEEKGKEILLGFYRNGVEMSLPVTVDATGKIGVHITQPNELYGTVNVSYGFFQSFPAGFRLGISTLKGYVSDMKYAFTKEGASNLGGFGTIGGLFQAEWDWYAFWMTTAFLSIILAVMNILPIPALDGGHVMFLIYEVITRRKPADKFMEYAQMVGMILLFSLLIYANGNDIFRFFFK